jgi:hypothetical protein
VSHLSIARQALVAFLDSPCVEHLSSKCPGVVPVPPADRCVGRCDRRTRGRMRIDAPVGATSS